MALGGRLRLRYGRVGYRGRALAVIFVVTVAAALTTPAGLLYAQIYPGPDTAVVTDKRSWQRAFAKASLHTGFRPESLVENETAQFTATISYGRALDPGPTIDVAYANDATLTPLDPQQFKVDPRTDMRQNLDEGTPDGRGGMELSWMWDVTPRATGALTLRLEIQPVVVLGDQVVEKLARRNKPIEIDVQVHPNRIKFDTVVAASDREFALTIPEKLTAEKDAVVTADLPLRGQGDAVQVTLAVVPAEQGPGVVA
jgi:hypothetical protein